jgi:hypothetical protein
MHTECGQVDDSQISSGTSSFVRSHNQAYASKFAANHAMILKSGKQRNGVHLLINDGTHDDKHL